MSAKILLADDSITIQKVVSLTLRDTDYELISVNNGDDAIEKAREVKPDIIIADVSMPGKNGYEVCKIVKNDPELKGIPVILMHGTFETFNEELAKQVGADDYLTKPFESKTFLQMIEKHLEKASAAEPSTPVETSQPSQEEEGLLLEEEVEELEEPSLLEGEGIEAEPALLEGEEAQVEEEGVELLEAEPIEDEGELLEAEPIEEGIIEEEGLLEAEPVEELSLEEEAEVADLTSQDSLVQDSTVEMGEVEVGEGEEAWLEGDYAEEPLQEEETPLASPEAEGAGAQEEQELLLEEEISEEKEEAEVELTEEWTPEPSVEGEALEETGESEALSEPLIEEPQSSQEDIFAEDVASEEEVLEQDIFEEAPASAETETEPFDEVISAYEKETPSSLKDEEITHVPLDEEPIPLEEEPSPLAQEQVETQPEPFEESTQPEISATPSAGAVSESEIRKVIREVAEKVVWEVVPDLVEMIVKQELEKRLKK